MTPTIYAAIGAVLLIIFRFIPNDKIKTVVGNFAYGIGVFVTLGLSNWNATAGLWQQYIEPWFIDLFDNTITAFVDGFTRGLRSDNTNGNDK